MGYDTFGKGVSIAGLKDAIVNIISIVKNSSTTKEKILHNRIAKNEGAIYYFLGDRQWKSVKITEKGWMVKESPIIFRKYPGQRAQVTPEKGGQLDDIFKFMNISSPTDQMLLKCYIISCLIPDISHPVFCIDGTHGSAKSFTMRIIKDMIDPSTPNMLDMSYKNNEMILQLFWQYAPFYDNISKLSAWQSNLLCRAATGEGFAKRSLYTDEEPVFYDYRRCVGINGISIMGIKPDLRDRFINFHLKDIPEDKRKKEEDLLREFEKAKPKIFGAMLDILSKAIKIKNDTKLKYLPRMADFSDWGEAIARAMGYPEEAFIKAYKDRIKENVVEALEENPLGIAITIFIREERKWEGTATDLLKRLNKIAEENDIDNTQKGWPKSESWLSRYLKEIIPELRAQDIIADFGWKENRRSINIEYKGGYCITEDMIKVSGEEEYEDYDEDDLEGLL